MNAKHLFRLSLVAVAFAAAAPFASAEGDSPTRADTKAAVLQARARGELIPAGQAVEPFAVHGTTADTRSRADLRAEVLQARAEGELVPAGQGMRFDATAALPSMLARAEVKETVRVARANGDLIPAGQGTGPTERQAHATSLRSASYAFKRMR
jgi:hypothetical protein